MVRIDLRNSITSLAILQIGSIMQKLSPGEDIEVICEDESFMEELHRVHQNYVYDRVNHMNDYFGSGIVFLLRKQ